MDMRVGIGTDLHRLTVGRTLVLGGVIIPFPLGADAHSDGDALTHAIIDALLGAAALGDIGEFFSPNDKKWKDAVSIDLLRIVCGKLMEADWEIVNIDSVISCEAPKILPYRNKICNSLADALGIDAKRIFVKGKTGEGLGDIGNGRAITARAVCLIRRIL